MPSRSPSPRLGLGRPAIVVSLCVMLLVAAATVRSRRARPAEEPAATGAARSTLAPHETGSVRYARDVRPILSEHCFACHGPDAKKRKSKLALDDAASATVDRGGYAAIVPGDVEASELVRRIEAEALDERMPPDGGNRRALTRDEQDVLRRWIADGARYEQHWSFVPPMRPPLPPVRDERWPR